MTVWCLVNDAKYYRYFRVKGLVNNYESYLWLPGNLFYKKFIIPLFRWFRYPTLVGSISWVGVTYFNTFLMHFKLWKNGFKRIKSSWLLSWHTFFEKLPTKYLAESRVVCSSARRIFTSPWISENPFYKPWKYEKIVEEFSSRSEPGHRWKIPERLENTYGESVREVVTQPTNLQILFLWPFFERFWMSRLEIFYHSLQILSNNDVQTWKAHLKIF